MYDTCPYSGFLAYNRTEIIFVISKAIVNICLKIRFLRQFARFFALIQLLPALETGEETLVGGQAVLEGVMMRSPHAWGIAVRKASGDIVSHAETLERPSEKHKWMGWPVIRGLVEIGRAHV